MMLIFLGIAGIYFGWHLAGCMFSAWEYMKERKEIKAWKQLKESVGTAGTGYVP